MITYEILFLLVLSGGSALAFKFYMFPYKITFNSGISLRFYKEQYHELHTKLHGVGFDSEGMWFEGRLYYVRDITRISKWGKTIYKKVDK